MASLIPIKTALVSVSDKRGVIDLCRGLLGCGVRLLSTGGTAQVLRDAGLAATEVAHFTGASEILDGRVKTLHPRIHGGLLGRPTEEHEREMAQHGIEPIDLLIVNLYPFAETIARAGASIGEAIEQIDIGGPAMIRSGSKNHERVTVVTDPADYALVLQEVRAQGGTSFPTRRRLARKAFALTAAYDRAIAAFFDRIADDAPPAALVPGTSASAEDLFPVEMSLHLHRQRTLRYGENPHQRAAFYSSPWRGRASLAEAEVLQGKELSYNNIIDLDAALALALDLPGSAAVIVKHSNPCGAAVDEGGALLAYRAARAADPVSAFGGIVAINRRVDGDLARELTDTFLECVIAPDYAEDALIILAKKGNLRVLRYREVASSSSGSSGPDELVLRSVAGGVLAQTPDDGTDEVGRGSAVTRRAPSDDERRVLDFAWRVAKHVKSNAIVLCRGSAVGALVVGVGAGQMSRVDSVRLAIEKAGDRAASSVMASDAFFPFRDGIEVAGKAGVTAIAQPGGSIRDAEVIAAADEHGMAMLFTQIRHFRH